MLKLLQRIFNNDYSNTLVKKMLLVLSSIINSAILNRYLGVELKGNYAVLMNYISLFALLLNLGIYHSFAYYRRKNQDDIKELKQKYIDIFTLQLLVYLLIPIIVYFKSDNITYTVAASILPLNVLTGQLGMMMLIEHLKFRSAVYIINSFLKLSFTTVVFLFFPPNIIYALSIMILYDVFFIIMYLTKLRIKPNLFKMDYKFMGRTIKFGFYPMLTGILSIMNYKFDVIILNQLVPVAQIGLYSTGAALVEYAWMIPDIFKEVMFSRTAKKNSIEDITFSLRVSTALIAGVIIFIITFGKQILFILYGNEFVPAYGVTIAIFAGVPVMMYYKILSPLYIAKGETKLNFITLLVSVILNIILNYFLIPQLGIVGAALASVISYSVCGYIFLKRFISDYNIRYFDILFIKKSDVLKIMKLIK